ncbi:MAG: NAD(P)H-dependent oxidoreductase [Acidobacteria bacterium]|nr:NAD(P)H-dependent oxidoreductase [Acidobacteriota bacterium]
MIVTHILSSHYPESFNKHLHDRFDARLRSLGARTWTYDLYSMKFDPVMRGDDFNPFFGKKPPREIQTIQGQIAESDVLTFFYPVWWNDMPAIMKGWIDRVFSKGFAYELGESGYIGKLNLKKVVLICTLGNDQAEVEAQGLEQAMRLKESAGVFGYCGVKEVEHHFLYSVYRDETIRQGYLDSMDRLAENLMNLNNPVK